MKSSTRNPLRKNKAATRRLLVAVVGLLAFSFSLGLGYAQVGGTFDLSWATVEGGGGTFSTGGTYDLGGTIGQADAGNHTGGTYSLDGGFWGVTGSTPQPTVTVTPVTTSTSTATVTGTATRTNTAVSTATATSTSTAVITATTTATATRTNTAVITATATPTRTPALGGVVVGHVTWQGISQPNARNNGITATLSICVGGVTQNYPVTMDASGFFTVTTELVDGTYNWRVKGVLNLATSGALTIAGGTSNQDMGTQWAGDCNNSNGVASVDFNILKATFGKSSGQTGYDARGDFNRDLVVASTDFNLLKNNFGQAGASLTCP